MLIDERKPPRLEFDGVTDELQDLDGEDFYNAMQRYRTSPMVDQREVVACFENVKTWIHAYAAAAVAKEREAVAQIEPTDGKRELRRMDEPKTTFSISPEIFKKMRLDCTWRIGAGPLAGIYGTFPTMGQMISVKCDHEQITLYRQDRSNEP